MCCSSGPTSISSVDEDDAFVRYALRVNVSTRPHQGSALLSSRGRLSRSERQGVSDGPSAFEGGDLALLWAHFGAGLLPK